MKWDEEKSDCEEPEDRTRAGYGEAPGESSPPEENLLSRWASWLRKTWLSLKEDDREIWLSDLLKLLICIPLAMTLAAAAIGLIRFSLTRAGAIFWLIVALIAFVKVRHRIFRD